MSLELLWHAMVAVMAAGAIAPAPRRVLIPVAAAESVAVEITGSGTPMVLIPGFFGTRYGFRKIVPLLNAAGYQTVVVEPLGIGGSSRPAAADYSLWAQSDRIATVLDSLAVSDAVFIAHSLGAAQVYRLAYRRPDLVSGLVSIEGAPAESATTPTFRRALKLLPLVRLIGANKVLRGRVRRTLRSSSGDPGWITDEVVRGYTADASRDIKATLRVFVAMGHSQEREPLAPYLSHLRCPVTLLLGAVPHEGGMRPEYITQLQGSLTRFSIDSIAGAGHFLHEEQPETVVAAVLRMADGLREFR